MTPDAQPAVVERGFIIPPKSSFDVLSAMEIQVLINQSDLYDKYTEAVDRESAYEILAAKVADEAAQKLLKIRKKLMRRQLRKLRRKKDAGRVSPSQNLRKREIPLSIQPSEPSAVSWFEVSWAV